MEVTDDELKLFEARGAAPLPVAKRQEHIENQGARIWYSTYGDGPAVILLHGGLGHGGNWGYQVPALVESGYRAIVIDSRGHGRSSRDGKPYSYELMVADVLAVMDRLQVQRAALVGWSDGACTALILADKHPERVSGVLFFACNMDPSGVKPFSETATLNRCFARHAHDYEELSETPDQFKAFVEAVSLMQKTQPDYTEDDLARICAPVLVAQGETEEFIKSEHARHLAGTMPNAELQILPGVSHFAPLQQPGLFNQMMLSFIGKVQGQSRKAFSER